MHHKSIKNLVRYNYWDTALHICLLITLVILERRQRQFS